MAIDITNMPADPFSGPRSQAYADDAEKKKEEKRQREEAATEAKKAAEEAAKNQPENEHTYLLDVDFEKKAKEASDKYDKLVQEGKERMNEGATSSSEEDLSEEQSEQQEKKEHKTAGSLTMEDYVKAAQKKEDLWKLSKDYLSDKVDKDGNPIEQSKNEENTKEEEKKNEPTMGSFKELDSSIKELSEQEILEAQVPEEAKKAYEALATGKYTLPNMNKYISTYAKYARECDKLYGPLIDKIKDDPALMRALQKELEENGNLTEADKEYIDKAINKNKIDDLYEEINRLFKESNEGTVADQNKFWLPDMGEFYLGNVDTTFLEKIDKIIRDKKDALKAAHYASLAPQETLGYDEKKKMHFLRFKIDLDDEDLENGIFDGSHIMLSLDKAESSEDDETGALEKLESTVEEINKKHYFDKLFPDENNDNINIDIVGISCPKMPRWCVENNAKIDNVTFEEFHKYDINENLGFVFVKEDYDAMDDNDTMLFVRVMGTWRQAIITEKED